MTKNHLNLFGVTFGDHRTDFCMISMSALFVAMIKSYESLYGFDFAVPPNYF